MSATTPHFAPQHDPVMVDEVLDGLAVRPGGRYIDATVGLGGHAERDPGSGARPNGGALLGIDLDPEALDLARESDSRPSARHGRAPFTDTSGTSPRIARAARPRDQVDGVLLRPGRVLAISWTAPGRGFSFQRRRAARHAHGSRRVAVTAAEVVNESSDESELVRRCIYRFGEERRSEGDRSRNRERGGR